MLQIVFKVAARLLVEGKLGFRPRPLHCVFRSNESKRALSVPKGSNAAKAGGVAIVSGRYV